LAHKEFKITERAASPMIDKYWWPRLLNETRFGFRYLLCALLSRGSVVKDQMLRNVEKRDQFLETILKQYHKDEVVGSTLRKKIFS